MDSRIEKAIELAKAEGFTYVQELDASTMVLLDDVRAMCAQNTCGMYHKNWACPPACGELPELREKLSHYTKGILVQTVGDVEDSLDFEAMMEIEAEHKETFLKVADLLREEYFDILPIGSGTCTRCKKCTYPDAPCRFPKTRVSSLEAYGILVMDLCKKNNMSYYYGSEKMAYTACYLLF